MDVRKKLVEIVCDAMEADGCIGHCNHPPCFAVERVVNALIANGVTVLPCNVGDKIYYIDRYAGKIDEDTVKFLTITKNGVKPILTYHNIKFWDFYELGKTAFFTREEAELHLPQPPKGETL